jgi:POT family proton-dependent oligopeptide transporter
MFVTNRTGFYIGLGLIALGSGGIKPCVAAFVGDQFDQTNKHRAKVVFEAFYWIINFGSFFASLLMPLFLRHLGPAVAFGVPGDPDVYFDRNPVGWAKTIHHDSARTAESAFIPARVT